MELSTYFKSVLEMNHAAIVICDLDHTILYMNPTAIHNYEKYGGKSLLGRNVLDCHNPHSIERIKEVVEWFKSDVSHNLVYTYSNEKQNKDVYMVALRDENQNLIGYYEKHEFRTHETMKMYDLW